MSGPALPAWLLVMVTATTTMAGHLAHAAKLSIACSAVGIEYQLCREGAEAWAANNGHEVELVQTPNLANERLALFQQMLAASSAAIDVYQIDIIWPGTLGEYFIDLNDYLDETTIDAHFPALISNNSVNGALKALPWFADAGLLYYRKDLLERYGQPLPETWQDLSAVAAHVSAKENDAGHQLLGFVFQGKAYEGLTCNALEWISSYNGGEIIAADGSIDITNPQAIEAVNRAAAWIGNIAPQGVLNYAEEEARGVFQSGRAVFMRNWPYAWALLNAPDSPVAGKVGVTILPKGGAHGRHASTLGGASLAVSRFSTQPQLAVELIQHLTSYQEQLRRARIGGFNPTLKAAYSDAEFRDATPLITTLEPVLASAVVRPAARAGGGYNRLSNVFWSAVHDTLAGSGDAADNLKRAERKLQRLRRSGRW